MSLLSNKRPQHKPPTGCRKSIVITWLQPGCSQRQNRRAMLLWATPRICVCIWNFVCVCLVRLGEGTFYVQVYVRYVYQACYACTILSLSTVKTFRNTFGPFLQLNNSSHCGYESFCVSWVFACPPTAREGYAKQPFVIPCVFFFKLLFGESLGPLGHCLALTSWL